MLVLPTDTGNKGLTVPGVNIGPSSWRGKSSKYFSDKYFGGKLHLCHSIGTLCLRPLSLTPAWVTVVKHLVP